VSRPRSLTLPLSVDTAARRHACQHNGKHTVSKGDRRLKVAVGRSHDHYCTSCARLFIQQAIERLRKLDAELRE